MINVAGNSNNEICKQFHNFEYYTFHVLYLVRYNLKVSHQKVPGETYEHGTVNLFLQYFQCLLSLYIYICMW
jgi:hypothetical protein